MKVKSMKQKMARGIAYLAERQVRNYVGKSLPIGVHEAKVPEAVRRQLEK